jgi:hypothetical protein
MDNGAAGSINRGVKGQPSLESNRLALRPLVVKDAISLRELANSPKVAYTCVFAAQCLLSTPFIHRL